MQFNFKFFSKEPGRLTRRTHLLLLIFGLTLLLIHLGDTRVLTRHEVFAAEPGREMIHFGTPSHWLLPTLAGQPRTAKPPGMMWLIASSIYIFRSQSEWAARLPSALAGLSVAIMIARLAARWFGDRIGRLAGLMQLTFACTLIQARLAEADMCLVAAVCAALCAFARATIDSPAGLDDSRRTRLTFWFACGAAFLLKGPIGLVFITLAIVSFGVVRRRGSDGLKDWRIAGFLADPIGIGTFIFMIAAWPIAAWRLDPAIVQIWTSEMIGSAAGKFGSDPFFYYVWSVPVVLLPWTPLVLIGLRRGPNAELAGPVVSQADRAMFWRFLYCWFVPGIMFLTIGMKMKHHHYPMPVLVPLTVPAALGFDYYVRRQASRRQPLIWPFFLAVCFIAALVVIELKPIPLPLKSPIVWIIALFAAGGLIALRYERKRRPNWVLAACFTTAWAVGVAIQAWIMPVQDDYKFQADFAKLVNASVPPGKVVYLLGHREEEQEAEYAYYLRFPMQRVIAASDFTAIARSSDDTAYAIAPADIVPEMIDGGEIQTLVVCAGLRDKETEGNRLRLVRVTRRP